MCQLLGIRHIKSSPMRPQTNGIVERFNKTLIESLACLARDHPFDWELFLPHAVYAFRTSYQTSLRCSPYEAAFGLCPRTPLDVHFGQAPKSGVAVIARIRRTVQELYPSIRANIEAQQARWKKHHDRKVHDPPLKVGDDVVLFCPSLKKRIPEKLQFKYSPGFKVQKCISEWNYLVSNGRFTTLVHRERLRRVFRRGPHLEINPDVLREFPSSVDHGVRASLPRPGERDSGLRPTSAPLCRPISPSVPVRTPPHVSPVKAVGTADPQSVSAGPRPDWVRSSSTSAPLCRPMTSATSSGRRRAPPARLTYDVLRGRNFLSARCSGPNRVPRGER